MTESEVIELDTDSEPFQMLRKSELVLRRAVGNVGECLEHINTNPTLRKNGKSNGHLYLEFRDCHTTSDEMYVAKN